MTAATVVRFEAAGRTSAGTRAHNDDHFLIGDLNGGLAVAQSSLPDLARGARNWPPLLRPVLMVADGVSGQAGAEAASAVTVRAVAGQLGQLTVPTLAGAAADAVAEGFRVAGGALRSFAESGTAAASSGTAAVVDWPRVEVVHLGHTRCYLLRDGLLKRLTTDHTVGEELRNRGVNAGPALHQVLTRAVGVGDHSPQRRLVELAPGDTLVVSSNGLNQALDEAALGEVLAADPAASAGEHCDALLRSALDAGEALRNVTVLVLTARSKARSLRAPSLDGGSP